MLGGLWGESHGGAREGGYGAVVSIRHTGLVLVYDSKEEPKVCRAV